MTDKPSTATGYESGKVELVKATCLHIAGVLGDWIDDFVIVGGLVPSLLVDQHALPSGVPPHVGTMDLDIGLEVALLDEERYQAVTERLRGAGFSPDRNAQGNMTRQRWKLDAVESITLDFLIPPSSPSDQGGRLRNIEPDFAALILPGLDLAFLDRERVDLTGESIMGGRGSRPINVCGPGAFVVLKALAFANRQANKDAYDLHYVVNGYGSGYRDVAARLGPLLTSSVAQRAVEILRSDFIDPEGFGPWACARFLGDATNVDLRADVAGIVSAFIDALDGFIA
jgi:hypothetical protein